MGREAGRGGRCQCTDWVHTTTNGTARQAADPTCLHHGPVRLERLGEGRREEKGGGREWRRKEERRNGGREEGERREGYST